MNSFHVLWPVLLFFVSLLVWKMTNEKWKWLALLSPAAPYVVTALRCFLSLIFFRLRTVQSNKTLERELPLFQENLKTYLKAGLTLTESLSIVTEQRVWVSYVGKCLDEVQGSVGAGIPLSESLRVPLQHSESFGLERQLAATLETLAVGFDTGGNLIQLLDHMQTTCTDFVKLKRKAKVYAAQMRFQATIIALAPSVLGVGFAIFRPQNIEFFFSSSAGMVILMLMIIMNIVGGWLIFRVGKITGL